MKLKKIFSLCLIYNLINGCSLLTPEYHKPTVAYMSSSRSGIKFITNPQDFSQVRWWDKFNDPVLNKLVSQALLNNNQVKIAQGNIMEAQAKFKVAQYSWLPTLNASGMGLYGNGFGTNFTPHGILSNVPSNSMGNLNFSALEGGFVPTYTFNVFANINNSRIAKFSLELKKAEFNAIRISIISQVTGGYFMLLGQKKQLKLQQELIADLIKIYQLQQFKIKVGTSDYTPLTLLEQQLQEAKAKVPQIENSIAQSENALRVLLGKNPNSIIANRDIASYNLLHIIPVNLPSRVLKNRPDILMAEDNLKIANANIGLARSMFFPTITLTGDIGAVSLALSNLFSLSTGFWYAEAAANMPILNASNFEEIKVAKGGYFVAYYNYMQTVKTAFAEVDNNLTNYQKMNVIYLATQKATDAITKYYNLAQIKNQVGVKDHVSVLNAHLNVATELINLNQAKMEQLFSIVQVYQSLAVGYAVGELAFSHSKN